jgi:hypothetical protein
MNRTKTVFFLLLLLLSQQSFCQTGPWAKYDQALKDGALYREASAGNLAEVKSIVEGGGNIHFADKQTKFTILMAAAGSGKIEVVQYLLKLGADPKAKDWWDQTAADKARSVGAKDIEQLLTNTIKGTPTPPIDNNALKPIDKPDDKVKPEDKKENKLPVIPTSQAAHAWPLFGNYTVGDSIIYWVPTGWRKGVVKEVGVMIPTGKISVDYSEKKYLIDPDAYALGNDWYEWTGVVKPTRQAFWTTWFIGNWQIGEVMAHHNDIKDGKEKDTYYYMDATETLTINANNTYSWKLINGKTLTGKWKPATDQPGIVLLKAYRDFDWTLRNATTNNDRSIRKLDIIDLTPSATVSSIKGKRKSTLQ